MAVTMKIIVNRAATYVTDSVTKVIWTGKPFSGVKKEHVFAE